MCRLRFVHECNIVGDISNECLGDKAYCCFDGCINSCVDIKQTTLLWSPNLHSRSSNPVMEDKQHDFEDIETDQNRRNPRLHSEGHDLMANIHGALYDFFMGEN